MSGEDPTRGKLHPAMAPEAFAWELMTSLRRKGFGDLESNLETLDGVTSTIEVTWVAPGAIHHVEDLRGTEVS